MSKGHCTISPRHTYNSAAPFTNQYENENETYIEFRPTPMRLNDDYVFYYVNMARLVVTGIVPLVALSLLNMSIYR
jgi:hypothetical protein